MSFFCRFLVVFLQSIYYNYTVHLFGWYFNCIFILVLQNFQAYCPVYFYPPPSLSVWTWSSVIISSVIGWMNLWVPTTNGWWKISQSVCSFVASFHSTSIIFSQPSQCACEGLLLVVVRRLLWRLMQSLVYLLMGRAGWYMFEEEGLGLEPGRQEYGRHLLALCHFSRWKKLLEYFPLNSNKSF